MNNETTASQPKSIGDDAQQALVRAALKILHRIDATGNKSVGFTYSDPLIDGIRAALVAIERDRAAQASATIQAAPIGWAAKRVDGTGYGSILYSNRQSAETANLHNGPAAPKYVVVPVFAATIQEPVMVAEPVGKRPISKEWSLKAAQAEQDSGVAGIGAGAAPMVADPAGVALTDAQIAEIYEQATSYPLSDDDHHGVIAFARGILAATVKAVPSEALDEPSEREALIACLEDDSARLADANPDDEMAQTMKEAAEMIKADGGINDLMESLRREKLVAPLLSNTAEYRACCDHPDCAICAGRGGFYRAAPLADKTGGGE